MIRILTLCFTFIIVTLCSIALQAQTSITGTIRDADEKKPVPGISVTIKPKGASTLLSYALTDDKGRYSMSFKSNADSVVLTISAMSIKKQTLVLANKDAALNLSVFYERIMLKEMKVKPPKIRRLDDTLNYDVDQFTRQADRTIGEVLKRMPGIEVGDNGSITYHGKPINKFYIENKDLLEGRYGIATNNVEAKDVAIVQVLENHQPIKALKDKEFTDQAAINIKLKETAKNVLVANAQLGVGASPFLWNNEAFGMYFGKDQQFMGTYKGNNTGDDSAAELQNFYGSDGNLSFPVALGIQSPGGPGVSRKRYLLNKDNAFSINSLRSLGKNYKLTTNISYLNDRQIRNSYSRDENYLPGDSTLVIEESISSLDRFHYVDGTLKLNANKEYFYFDDALKFSGDLQRDEYGSVANTQLIEQNRSAPYFRMSNNLSVIKNFKKTTFRINSYNGYGRINDRLDVQPLLYPKLFTDSGILSGIRQSLIQKMFVSYNNVGFGINHGSFKQNYVAGANANLIQLNSSLQSVTDNGTTGNSTDSLSNDLDWNRYDLYISPEYTFINKKINAVLKLPVNYLKQNKDSHLFFNPSFFATYNLNLLWKLNASASYSRSIDGLENGFTGYIMQSYRYLLQNQGQLPEYGSQSYSMRLSYTHPIKLLFGSLLGGYYRNKTNLLYGNEFQGFLAIRRTLAIPNSASGYNFSFNIGKDFEGFFRKVTWSGSYNNNENVQLNQSMITRFQTKSLFTGLSVDAEVLHWADANYSLNYARSENVVENNSQDFSPISSISQGAGLSLFPLKGIILKLKYDYSYNSAVTGSGRLMNFADANIRYKLKKIEFSLDYNNIFNTKRYVVAAYNGIGTYYASYDLRPTQVLAKIRFKIK